MSGGFIFSWSARVYCKHRSSKTKTLIYFNDVSKDNGIGMNVCKTSVKLRAGSAKRNVYRLDLNMCNIGMKAAVEYIVEREFLEDSFDM